MNRVHLTVKNKDYILFDGDASSVTSYNEVGPFDILPMHENFISLIKDKVVIHDKKDKKEMKIESGVLKARNNRIDIYLGL